MSNTFKFKILTPNRVVSSENVTKVLTRSKDGEIEFLYNHVPIIISTEDCITQIVDEKGNKINFFTSKGVINLNNKELILCCDASEACDEIDINRAKEAKERAEKRLMNKSDKIDAARAQRSLNRALIRMKIKNK